MSRGAQLALVIVFLVFCGYLIYPTVRWYFATDSETKELLSLSQEGLYARLQEKILVALSRVRSLDEDDALPEESLFLVPYVTSFL